MKKTFLISAFSALFFTLLCIGVSADDTLDIGLFYGNSAKSSVTVTTSYGSVTVNAADVGDELVYDTQTTVSVDGKEYRGSIILKKNDSGLITVINRVNMEDYIASVVSKEMSPSFGKEALKAQAVCARTYAVRYKGKHKAYGFDLCTSTDCQAYGGVASESAQSIAAAQETAGMVMKYNGSPIEAVYSATSGGWTEDVKNVWGSDIPYLSAVEDPYESKDVYGSTWTREITVERASEIMNNKGYNLGTVTAVTVEEQTERGVVTKLKVTGTNGEKTFTREGCRLAFGSVVLSQAFSVTPNTAGGIPSEPLYVAGGAKISGSVSVISADGISKRELDDVTLQGTSSRFYQAVTGGGEVLSFTFNGRGNGHLVGMSQNGANGMAAAGFAYDEILKHYYKGIEITWN